MNKLDDKVIIDRKTLVELDKFARKLGYDRHKLFAKLNKALATDLTEWVAVPIKINDKMLDAACTRDKDGYVLPLTYSEAYRAMLAACPPLPGGKE